MRLRTTSTLTLALLVLGIRAVPIGAQAAPDRKPVAQDQAQRRVDGLFAQYDSATTPGCAVGVSRGGAVLMARAYGMADLERPARLTPESVFEAGSASKQFTAAAILLLEQDRKLRLDDPVRRYLPELPDYGARYPGRTLTIRQLLGHTGGLRDWSELVAAGGWPRGTRVYTHAHVLELAARQRGLNFAPGSDFLYTNTGYVLLATIVERVSGESLSTFTRRRLFEPLGMTHTQWRDDHTRTVPGRALAYRQDPDGFHLSMPFENTYGHAGLLTTVGDLLRWNAQLARPTSVAGGPALVAALEARARLDDGRTVPYGGGLYVTAYRGAREINHGGSTAGYRAFLTRITTRLADSTTDVLSVALLCNAATANTDRLAHATADVFLGPPTARAPNTPVGVSAATIGGGAPGAHAARAGLYRHRDSGQPLTFAADSAGLRIQGWTTLVAERTTTGARYRSPDGSVAVAFETGPLGRRTAVRIAELDPTGDTATFAVYLPDSVVSPTPARLAGYSGSYVSTEIDASYIVTVDSTGLALQRGPGATFRLHPIYADAFTAPGLGLVRFARDGKGAVTGLCLTLGRARDLEFARRSVRARPDTDRRR